MVNLVQDRERKFTWGDISFLSLWMADKVGTSSSSARMCCATSGADIARDNAGRFRGGARAVEEHDRHDDVILFCSGSVLTPPARFCPCRSPCSILNACLVADGRSWSRICCRGASWRLCMGVSYSMMKPSPPSYLPPPLSSSLSLLPSPASSVPLSPSLLLFPSFPRFSSSPFSPPLPPSIFFPPSSLSLGSYLAVTPLEP